MQAEKTQLEGCLTLHPIVRPDERGYFVKTFQKSVFGAAGITTDFPEHFFSQSHQGVVRGLHFQTPPAAQDKVVFCTDGEVFDVVVDLRVGSPTYGQHQTFTLSGKDWMALYIPIGFAHGFAATSDSATMAYLVSHEYAPDSDGGVRWDSAGIDWPFETPIVSARDQELPTLDSYSSPFTFK